MVTVKVDMARDIARLKAATGKEYRKVMDGFMEKQGRNLVSSSGTVPGLVQITAPHSQNVKGAKAKKQGEDAISTDINRVYGSASVMYADIKANNEKAAAGFWRAVKQEKDWAKAQRIAMSILGRRMQPFDGGSEHKQRRNNAGRVSGRRPSVWLREDGGNQKRPSKSVDQYIKTKQKLVGTMAAALVASAESEFGPAKGVPSWVRRQVGRSFGGKCRLIQTTGKWIVSAAVTSHRAQKDMQRKFDKVVSYRLESMARELPHVAKHFEKKLHQQLR